MFTGIVEEVGLVKAIAPPEPPRDIAKLLVEANVVLADMRLGDSIGINGACLTVVATTESSFAVELAPETLRRTNLGSLTTGTQVNLERSLAASGRLGGHIVQGHVDATGHLASEVREGDSMMMTFEAPENLMPYIVQKGFIAVDGVSLTVVEKGATSFSISVIPYTRENTIFRERRLGDMVNLEVDIVAKYIESLLNSRS